MPPIHVLLNLALLVLPMVVNFMMWIPEPPSMREIVLQRRQTTKKPTDYERAHSHEQQECQRDMDNLRSEVGLQLLMKKGASKYAGPPRTDTCGLGNSKGSQRVVGCNG